MILEFVVLGLETPEAEKVWVVLVEWLSSYHTFCEVEGTKRHRFRILVSSIGFRRSRSSLVDF